MVILDGKEPTFEKRGYQLLWFAQGSASYRKPPQASPSRSAAATAASRRSKRRDRLRAGLGLILGQRGADMAELPGGASGLLCRNYKGKEPDPLVTRINPMVVSPVAELRGYERQAAEELGQRKTVLVRAYKGVDYSCSQKTGTEVRERRISI